MHMSDALLSPAVGAAGWLTAAGFAAYSAREVRRAPEASPPALMGVLGAFVFAAQMINFTIPATGSSGHLGGGLLLAVLLGPHAAFLVMASVLTVQALLFADGGLLALGCNVVNLGLFTCFVAYPFLFRPLVGSRVSPRKLTVAALVTAIAGLELGAFAVVLETTASGISQLPFPSFVAFMLPIHLAIGVVEGLVTAGVVLYVWQARPDLVRRSPERNRSLGPLVATFAVAAVLVGGALSWFASTHPDGLEWSAGHVSGTEELPAPTDGLHGALARWQSATSLLPDYSFGSPEEEGDATEPAWPAPDPGTSVSGVVGGAIVLLVALGTGLLLRWARSRGKGSRSSDPDRPRDLADPLA
ncbi:MAG TPA: energy-coupling factor ABC transporter permease [Polyangiaceae bacterium]|nr:energy-coupling factor ABC transporter permease [Polyangiaceae bacterium]